MRQAVEKLRAEGDQLRFPHKAGFDAAVAAAERRVWQSQTALGKMLGIAQPQISRLEIGEHSPSLEMLQRLARGLGLRFIVEIAPTERATAAPLSLPAGVEVVEDVSNHI